MSKNRLSLPDVRKPRMKKAVFGPVSEELNSRLLALQRKTMSAGIPVLIVFEGWDAAGKGTALSGLLSAFDPRGTRIFTTHPPTREETLRPPLWRFWTKTPANGSFVFLDEGWFRPLLDGIVDGSIEPAKARSALQDAVAFERQLADSGCLVLKFFLHITRKEQSRRFKTLKANRATAWRVTKEDRRRHRRYDDYRAAAERLMRATDAPGAGWRVIDANDRRRTIVEVGTAVAEALEERLREHPAPGAKPARSPRGKSSDRASGRLARLNLSLDLPREKYETSVSALQDRIGLLHNRAFLQRLPVVIVFEGWDASGKGGAIRRLVRRMDPRGYDVVPVSAPTPTELNRHYMHRFWLAMPKAGHVTIFDRSWYGRVLVERVESLCPPDDWQRAYGEINELERHVLNFGALLLKFWMHIDRKEQYRRFRARATNPEKKWKISPEDWRNRRKWQAYEEAAEDMFRNTSRPGAGWTLVEANCKLHARIKVLSTVASALERRLDR